MPNMTSTQSRVQAGVPSGGQFAAAEHAEADLELDVDEEPVVVQALAGLDGDAVRESYTSGSDGDEMAGVTDQVLDTAIAEHQREIGRAMDRAYDRHEDDAWNDFHSVCATIAQTAIEKANAEERIAADGSLSMVEWQRRCDGRVTIPAKIDHPISPGHSAVIYTGVEPMRGEVLSGPYTTPLGGGASPVYDVLADGRVHRRSSQIVVPAEDFDQAWHVVRDGAIVAGGPRISEERAREIARERGGDVQQGFPNPTPIETGAHA